MEMAKWRVHTKLEKFLTDEDFNNNVGDVIEFEGNMLLNEGVNALWNLVCGAGGTAFNAANAFIGVGDSSASAAATQIGMQATANKLYKGMDSTYPQSGASQKATFKSTFASADANFTWNEWTVSNGSSDASINLNRKVEVMGTKASGSTWVITVDISLS